MKNPIISFRRERDLSRSEFAQILDVSYTTLSRTEAGSVRELPQPIEEALNEVSFDKTEENDSSLGQELADEYDEWRESRTEQLREEFEGGQN